MHEIVGMIRKDKIIAIIRGLEKGNLAPVVEALVRGGIRLIEITRLTGAYLASGFALPHIWFEPGHGRPGTGRGQAV